MAETVAFLFSDLAGSTGLLAGLGTDAYGKVLSAYRDAVEKAAAEHDGEVVDREGDGIFLVFPTAAGAIRAAADAQRSLAATRWPDDADVAARMGVHVGEAQRHQDGYVGLDVHRAARVGSVAHGGQVLVSDTARSLARDGLPEGTGFRDLGEHHLKGLDRPERLHQLVAPGLAEDFPPLATSTEAPNNLPAQPTSFVGRERELVEVTDLVRRHRLVTVTGVGGAGKTRLALEAAAQLATAFRGGTWLVELGAITDAEAVPRQVATTLRVREHDDEQAGTIQDRLVAHLREREALLVLDNCEHLLAGAARLCDRLLHDCPDLTVLATSREGLGIAGERLWQVPSLALPDPDAPDVEETDAVHLFAERARAVAPDFTLSDDTRPLVARICRRLDGIPLAIELAAARVRVLGLDALAERLDDRFRVLTGGSRTALPRQQTLAAAIDWSYELLDDDEATLFRRLAVFAGSFTLEAAEEVCAGGGIDELDVLDLLTHLVDKSMVTPVEVAVGGVHYRLLETLRAYARDRLASTETADELRRRHRDHYLRLAVRIGERLRELAGSSSAEHQRVRLEREDLQAALDWSLDVGDHEAVAHLADVLGWYWLAEGYQQRAAALLRLVLDGAELEPEREAEVRGRLGAALSNAGDLAAGLHEIERAHGLLVDADPSLAKAVALDRYARAIYGSVDRDARDALAPARRALEVVRTVDHRAMEVRVLMRLGSILGRIGEMEEASARLRDALRVARGHGDPDAILTAHRVLGSHLESTARHGDEARRHVEETLEWFEATGGRERYGRGALDLHSWVSYTFLRTGEWDRVEESLEEMTSHHLEGFTEGWLHQVRGSLRWMQGRLDAAAADHEALRRLGIRRWFHDLFPVAAEIAALRGDLDTVRHLADEYLVAEVDASEEGLKIAVLRPLVHAEVGAALAATGTERDEHVRRARDALQRMRDIDEGSPPPPPVQFELPPASLAFAAAELSRATGPDPGLWRAAHDEAYHRYWQLYARWRLAEALLAVGERDEGEDVLRETHDEAAEIGAGLIRDKFEVLADRTGVTLPRR